MQMYRNSFLQNNTKSLLDKISSLFKKILPIYWAFLTYMLLRPGIENIEFPFMFTGIDKLLHLSIFGMLGFCFIVAFPKIKLSYYIYILLIYSLLTEIAQDEMKLGRSLEFLDLIADTIGFCLGYIAFIKLKRVKF